LHRSLKARKEFWLGIIALLAFLVIYFSLALTLKEWPGRDDSCVSHGSCYCEAARQGGIKQPVSTISALAFSAVGLSVLWVVGSNRVMSATSGIKNPMTRGLFYPTAYGGIAVFMGPGSMMFHTSLKAWGGWLDLFSIILLIGFLATYNVQRVFDIRQGQFALLGSVVCGSLACAIAIMPMVGLQIFMVAAVGTGLLELLVRWKARAFHRSGWTFLLSLAALAIGLLFWLPSRGASSFCHPHSLLQPHSVWHLAAACFVGLMFLYLRSEVSSSPDRSRTS
jgi:hypothetical protein